MYIQYDKLYSQKNRFSLVVLHRINIKNHKLACVCFGRFGSRRQIIQTTASRTIQIPTVEL